MANSKRFAGTMVALATPLSHDETIDEAGLRRLIVRMLDAGIHGVVVLGSAGEFAALADSEKRRAIEITVDEVAGRVPVIAGTGEPGTKRAVHSTKRAADLGADAALVVPPYYYRVNPSAVLDHYRAIASESGLPILLYNIPFFTKVTLDQDTVCQLAQEPGIVGIKDSGGNFGYFQSLVESFRSTGFSVVTGSDRLLFASLAVGGDGNIGPCANVTPSWFVALWDAAKESRWDDAWRVQQRIMAFGGVVGLGGFPAGLKGALAALGICRNTVSSPMTSLTDAQMEEVGAKLREFGLL
jgi:4-hydroxy-tetrahydrodipicolinate synthase